MKRLEATLLAKNSAEPRSSLDDGLNQQVGHRTSEQDNAISKPLNNAVPQQLRKNSFSMLNTPQPRSRNEALERYGKSSTEHFALTLNASSGMGHPESDKPPSYQQRSSTSRVDSSDIEEETACDVADGENQQTKQMSEALRDQPLLYGLHARLLLDLYFNFVHPIWPLVIENESRSSFDETYLFNRTCDSTIVAQMYLMMALACQYFERPCEDVGAPAFDAIAASRELYIGTYTLEHLHLSVLPTSLRLDGRPLSQGPD